MTTKLVNRSVVSLKLPRPVPALIATAKSIVTAMTGNPHFPSPEPPLSALSGAITELETAQTAALARTHGAATARNEKRASVATLLEQVKGYIQKTADTNHETAASVIQSAGVSVRKPVARAPRVFAAKPGAVSGAVQLRTNSAARRASYEWQYSTDGGKTWQVAASTLQAKTTVMGLTPGATVQFRYRAVTRTGEGDWSQPTALIVK